jgi:hypothetical protein
MPAILGESAFGFELRDGGRIRGVAVGVDHSRRRMVCSAERFGKKALGCGRVLLGSREGSRGWRRWNPPPGKDNATCILPGRRSRPCASCHWWASGGGVSTVAIRARTAEPIATL